MEAVYISGCLVYMWCVTLFQPTELLTLISRLVKVIYKDKYNKKWRQRTGKSVQLFPSNM